MTPPVAASLLLAELMLSVIKPMAAVSSKLPSARKPRLPQQIRNHVRAVVESRRLHSGLL